MAVISAGQRRWEVCSKVVDQMLNEGPARLAEIKRDRLYVHGGYTSWDDYATRALRMSVRNADMTVTAYLFTARLLLEDPTVQVPASIRAALTLKRLAPDPANAVKALNEIKASGRKSTTDEICSNRKRLPVCAPPAPAQRPIAETRAAAPERVKPDAVTGSSPALAVRNVTRLADELLAALAALPADALTAAQRATLTGLTVTVRDAFEQLRLF